MIEVVVLYANIIAISILVALIGLSDFWKRRVPDVYAAALWVCFSGVAIWFPLLAALAVCAFAWLFFLNAAWVVFKRPEPVLAWGDILAAPPMIGMVGLFAWDSPLPAIPFAVTLGVMLLAPHFNKERAQPAMAYFAVGYLAALIVRFLIGI